MSDPSNSCCGKVVDNCTQQVPTVKLDPTTKLGASCALAGHYPEDEYPCFEPFLFNFSE